MLKILAN